MSRILAALVLLGCWMLGRRGGGWVGGFGSVAVDKQVTIAALNVVLEDLTESQPIAEVLDDLQTAENLWLTFRTKHRDSTLFPIANDVVLLAIAAAVNALLTTTHAHPQGDVNGATTAVDSGLKFLTNGQNTPPPYYGKNQFWGEATRT